jgi:hypothetical protein
MKVLIAAAAAVIALVGAVAATAGNGNPNNAKSSNVATFAVYGDAPYYTTPGDTDPNDYTNLVEFKATPAFINTVNHDSKVSLVVHVGDIHSGSQRCTQPYDQAIYDLWTAFKDPLVYTPGDNEWSDCQKKKQLGTDDTTPNHAWSYSGGDPIANLDLVRSIFFSNPGYTLGGRPMRVVSQAQVGTGTDARYVENVMWEQTNTMFVTVNIPGGSNNDSDVWFKDYLPAGTPETAAQTAERTQRTQADIDWLDAAFAQAQKDGVGSVVIIEQADMWDVADTATHQTLYEPIIADIAANTTTFGKPVLLFNGDSHVYRSDNPLVANSSCVGDPIDSTTTTSVCSIDAYTHHPGPVGAPYHVPNFHRITVHGSTLPLEYLRLTDDPQASNPLTGTSSFGPFSWERAPVSS